jgi:hypothetical protein
VTRTTLACVLGSVLVLSGCSVGRGVGAASGFIFELGCLKTGDYCTPEGICGTPDALAPFDLEPSYFAGEPIDDLRAYSGGSQVINNRLIIKLQRTGKQIELNDVLTFDVTSSYEVARCVRGAIDQAGKNDWDPENCYRASENAPGRVRVQFDSVVHGSLALKSTCTANLIGSAISSEVPDSYAATPRPVVSDGNWTSWVEFEQFGSASQYDTPATQRTPIDARFRIGLGDRIYASRFFLTLTDDAVLSAAKQNLPKPDPLFGGTLGGDPTTGRFDFDLQRGQGAQFFP